MDFGPANGIRPGNIDYNEFKYGVEYMISECKSNPL